MYKIKNEKGEELPEEINKLANERFDKDYNYELFKRTNKLINAFNWHNSKEGDEFWRNINVGDYRYFYFQKKQEESVQVSKKQEKPQQVENLERVIDLVTAQRDFLNTISELTTLDTDNSNMLQECFKKMVLNSINK